MSRAELWERTAQAFSKQIDASLYAVGLNRPEAPLRNQPLGNGKFFFDPLEALRRAELVQKHLPQEANAIIQGADEICRHEFRLLGCDKIIFGSDIDWHFIDHERSSPLVPWFKITFLDYTTVGDHKLVWELNRHQHLVTLAKACLFTGNGAYAKELAAQWYSWRRANPFPLGINWASTLEVAFRSLSWLWIKNLLAGCSDLPAAFHSDLLLALQQHGKYIERYLSTYFSPNTHLLGEAVGLFFIGQLCPEIKAANRWRDRGWKIVLQESGRQVRPDGVYFEQALYYHVYALDFFLHARTLAKTNQLDIPRHFDIVLHNMLGLIQALSANGPTEGFGDDDGGRVFNPRRNRVEHMTDPLALGALIYGTKFTGPLTEESIWLYGEKAIQSVAPTAPPTAACAAFTDGGIYLINDLKPIAQQMMIDAGPLGSGRGGHGHADALSVRFSVGGHRILADSGTYCYVCASGERAYFRGTAAHNTIRIDKQDQSIPNGPFAWQAFTNMTIENWANGQTFDLFVGSHDGYERLPDPVMHRRFVFHPKGGLWLVRDVMLGEREHCVESFWHFAPGIILEQQGPAISVKVSSTAEKAQQCSLIFIAVGKEWKTEMGEGIISPAYGSKQSAPVLQLSTEAKLPLDCAVVFAAGTQTGNVGSFSTIDEGSLHARGYRYRQAETTEFIFFAEENGIWNCGPWSGDSKFFYCKLEGSRVAHVIMVAGSFVEWRGQSVVSLPSFHSSYEQERGTQSGARSSNTTSQGTVLNDFEAFDPSS